MNRPVRPSRSRTSRLRANACRHWLRTPLSGSICCPDGRTSAEARNLQPTNALQDPRRGERRRQSERSRRGAGRLDGERRNAGQGVAFAARTPAIPVAVVAIEPRRRPSWTDGGARRAHRPAVPMMRPGRRGAPRVRGHGRAFHPSLRQSRFHRRPRTMCRNPGGRAGRSDCDLRNRGGGLITRRQRDQCQSAGWNVLGADPIPPRLTPFVPLREGGPRRFNTDWQESFVDGAGGRA